MSIPTVPMGYDVITASGQLLYASTHDYAMRIQAQFGGTIYHSNTTDPAPHPPPLTSNTIDLTDQPPSHSP